MKDFLYYVAQDILQKYGTQLADIAVVFPNKRASLFLNDHLAHLAQKPLWSPAYITISDLFRRQSPMAVADPIKLVCDLHKSFCALTGSQETLDKFYGWGQLLVSDFDDVDKNMADANRVFANLRDIHELDDVSYLTPEQREMIGRFFSNFSDQHNTELKERFLRLWSHFADIYHDFNRRLASQGLAYEGALYRSVVEQLKGHSDLLADAVADDARPIDARFPYKHYLFVGFNLVQKVEQQLFSLLQKHGKAHFYWDFDQYYLQRNEAGQFIAQYLTVFPNELDNHDNDIYANFSRSKQITYVSAPTENIQARYVSTWLRESVAGPDGTLHPRYQDGRRTAIVMCDEQLLQTVIHCLPPEVDKVNITTGYPLGQTPIASLLQQLINLQVSQYPPRHLRIVRRHPYARYISEDTLTLRLPRLTPHDLTSWLIDIVRQVAAASRDDISDPLSQESLFRAYTLLNRLNGLATDGDLTVDINTLTRLIQQLVTQTSIPFHGEPAEGIQVMGILETRNLDFDHVLLLSTNEGNMPKGVNDSSFIPHSLRHAYELTTVENKVSIYAYYFHQLLQRATDVTLLYNSSTEDGQRGEMSRFMLQLMVESPHRIARHILQSGQTLPQWQPQPIGKSQAIMEFLIGHYALTPTTHEPTMLSPTAINRYMRCPLQFYYRYVANIQEPEIPDDEQELDNRIFGNIFHQAADTIYHRLPARIERPLLQHLLKDKVEIERAVDEAFLHELPHAPASGMHIINREVIIRYLRQLLQIDLRLAPFTILGLEHDVSTELTIDMPAPWPSPMILSIGGRIDRLDQLSDGTIRVIDYKTGSRRQKSLADVDAIFQRENIHEHSDYYLQTFLYADIVSSQQAGHPASGPCDDSTQRAMQRVSPALLFIQHAGADDYDPTLCFGREPIGDVAEHAARFRELLHQEIAEIFDPSVPFMPTTDLETCQHCPYAAMCRS